MHPRKPSQIVAAIMASALVLLVSCGQTQRPDGGSGLLLAGQSAPRLNVKDHKGKELNLERMTREQAVLVYFYPKDNTPGCTKEACALRDTWSRYLEAKVAVIGVSSDSKEKHLKFAEEHHLPFSLVADTEGEWGRAFGVSKTIGFYSRVSFLLGPGLRIEKVYKDVDPGLHASQVLADVAKMQR